MYNLSTMIVFEGLDGAGTTTQSKLLKNKLEENGKKVFQTHEPTDNPIGRVVRDVLQKKFTTTAEALALLYSADRHDHIYNEEYGIKKHIENGDIIIADRYFYSSIAYQGVECDIDFIRKINTYPTPGFVIFIDTPVDNCIDRIEKRGDEKELFDREEYLEKVRNNYISEFSSLSNDVKFLSIDGRLSIDEIHNKVWNWIKSFNL